MKIFGITIETKKELRARIAELETQNAQVRKYNEDIANEYEKIRTYYPLDLGATMYDVQLRGEDGKYTRTKASREHSLINEVVVTEANYFKLKKRMLKEDVFYTLDHAKKHLDEVCLKYIDEICMK